MLIMIVFENNGTFLVIFIRFWLSNLTVHQVSQTIPVNIFLTRAFQFNLVTFVKAFAKLLGGVTNVGWDKMTSLCTRKGIASLPGPFYLRLERTPPRVCLAWQPMRLGDRIPGNRAILHPATSGTVLSKFHRRHNVGFQSSKNVYKGFKFFTCVVNM